MGNSISLEENENEDQGIESSGDIEMKSSVSQNESGENSSNNDIPPPTTVKKSKRASSDAVKKRRTTSKNGNASALKKTKSVRRR
jgi:hypothetical protein